MLYYDTNNSGHGLSLDQHPDIGWIGTWYCFDGDGKQMWLLLQNGNIYKPEASVPGWPLAGQSIVGDVIGYYEVIRPTPDGMRLSGSIKSAVVMGSGIPFSPAPPEFIQFSVDLTKLF